MRAAPPATGALDTAEAKAVEARRVADAYAEQVQLRRQRWEAATAAQPHAPAALERAWTDYQHSIAQYRAACQTARRAESFLANVLEERRHGHFNA